jgi:Ca-activated chloride channel family protein
LFLTPALLCMAANRLFTEGKFADALQKYARALELDADNPILRFNSGDALYRQQQLDKAREQFAKAGSANDLGLSARAHYNMGNTYLQEGNADAAIEEYKNALRCDPSDPLAKRNLEIAQKRKQSQQNNQQQSDKQQDQKDKQQQSQPQQDQQKGSKDQQAKPQESQQRQGEQQKQQQAQAMPMTPEEARALLRQAAYEDSQVRREIARVVPETTQVTGKDW